MTQTAPAYAESRRSAGIMRAAALQAPMRFEVCDAPLPQPKPGEVRVRIEGCGVCASNIPPWEGRDWFKYPFEPGQLGHEGWGWIDALGEGVTEFRVGQRVGVLSYHAYAQYDVAPVGAVVNLPPMLDDVPFPAEPLGCAVNVFNRCGVHCGGTVAIVGIGFLGAVLTRLASLAGARVIAISRRAFALDIARQMGAEETIPMLDRARIIERVGQLTGGRFCDVTIEAVGKQAPLDLAAELTAQRGRMVVAGYHQDGMRQCNLQLWNWRGFDVINAHERDPRIYLDGMRAAVERVASGKLDASPLYTHRFGLEQLSDALALTRDRPEGFMKALIMM